MADTAYWYTLTRRAMTLQQIKVMRLRRKGRTFEECGRALGLGRERARAIEMQALRKCYRILEAKGCCVEYTRNTWWYVDSNGEALS